MISDTQLAFLLIAVVILTALVGGTTAGAIVAMLTSRRQINVKTVADEILTVPVQLRADPVTLRVMIIRPEPITIEVQPVAAEDRADIAARIIAERFGQESNGAERFGQIGPRALARILNVSPSTAQAYIQKATVETFAGNTPPVSAATPPEEIITQ
jgi:hypothetical protein